MKPETMKPKSVAFNALFKASADGSGNRPCRSPQVECRGSRVDDTDSDPDTDTDPDPDLDETLKP